MLAVPWAATAGVLVRSPLERLDGQFRDLAGHRQLQVHALQISGGLGRLLQQAGRVRERLPTRTLDSGDERAAGDEDGNGGWLTKGGDEVQDREKWTSELAFGMTAS